MSTFAADISKWSKKTSKGLDHMVKEIVLKLFGAVIRDTPISDRWHSGRLKGNWRISANAPMSGIINIQDPTGAMTQATVLSFVKSLSISKTDAIFLTNSQPAAFGIEYGASRKAPSGMVRKNFIEITQQMKVPR